MYQEALRSPKLLRAQALWEQGILVIPQAYSSIGGEPLRENGEIVCVEYMDNESLKSEEKKWATLAQSVQSEFDINTNSYIEQAIKSRKSLLINFGIAAAGVMGSFLIDTKALSYSLAAVATTTAIKGAFSLKSERDNDRTRVEDFMRAELINGNAVACQWEMIKRNAHRACSL